MQNSIPVFYLYYFVS